MFIEVALPLYVEELPKGLFLSASNEFPGLGPGSLWRKRAILPAMSPQLPGTQEM